MKSVLLKSIMAFAIVLGFGFVDIQSVETNQYKNVAGGIIKSFSDPGPGVG
ncbi:hypothetical protein [Ectobacillus antri]|uniref:hypothetical protein n=1 Tax=Ectobacillus antri TaxID=2486280 RepID=UPI0013DE1B24|nr:hypothetical protein [Ectobacillus antri]